MSESLSDKIAGILSAAPVTFDPEDDVYEETAARVETGGNLDEGSDVEEALSSFRKQNVDLLEDTDKRYEGKRGSRKQLLGLNEWESEDEDSLQELEESERESDAKETAEEDEVSVEGEKEEEYNSGSSYDDSDKDYDDSDLQSEDDKNFKHLETSDTSNQIKKGVCVRQQLSMWENLLEIRIQLQKCLLTANKLPQIETFNFLKQKCGIQFTDKVAESQGHVTNLLDKLLYLQLLLLKRYPETKKMKINDNSSEIDPETKKRKISDGSSEIDPETKKSKVSDYNSEIDKRFEVYKDYRNSVIQKWNDKTRIATNKSGNLTHSVTNQIEHILNDKEKLIKRTQLKRTDYEIVGDTHIKDTENQNANSSRSSEEYNVDIFDDTDFYHHLLRELIEFKSADLTDPVQLGRQWIQLQNLRSKMKRKIDTKATKGRKIRYVVHSKLVNFMAPIEESAWHEDAKSELYNSLFGKNQSVNRV